MGWQGVVSGQSRLNRISLAFARHSGESRNPGHSESNGLLDSGFRRSIRVDLSRDFQAEGAYSATQGLPRRATAFTCSSNFRITATNAAFLAFPRWHRP